MTLPLWWVPRSAATAVLTELSVRVVATSVLCWTPLLVSHPQSLLLIEIKNMTAASYFAALPKLVTCNSCQHLFFLLNRSTEIREGKLVKEATAPIRMQTHTRKQPPPSPKKVFNRRRSYCVDENDSWLIPTCLDFQLFGEVCRWAKSGQENASSCCVQSLQASLKKPAGQSAINATANGKQSSALSDLADVRCSSKGFCYVPSR